MREVRKWVANGTAVQLPWRINVFITALVSRHYHACVYLKKIGTALAKCSDTVVVAVVVQYNITTVVT